MLTVKTTVKYYFFISSRLWYFSDSYLVVELKMLVILIKKYVPTMTVLIIKEVVYLIQNPADFYIKLEVDFYAPNIFHQ